MALYALTTIGPDRPSILARLSGAMDALGCNLEDLSATILRGHGALMMIIKVPPEIGEERLAREARAALAGSPVSVHLERCVEEAAQPTPTPTHVLSVYGADRPGIVHRITSLLAQMGVNITDIDSRIVGRTDRPIYAMLVEVELPAGVEAETLRESLTALGRQLQVDVSLRQVD
jgi:glycine cleavage system transcriptional repressor